MVLNNPSYGDLMRLSIVSPVSVLPIVILIVSFLYNFNFRNFFSISILESAFFRASSILLTTISLFTFKLLSNSDNNNFRFCFFISFAPVVSSVHVFLTEIHFSFKLQNIFALSANVSASIESSNTHFSFERI